MAVKHFRSWGVLSWPTSGSAALTLDVLVRVRACVRAPVRSMRSVARRSAWFPVAAEWKMEEDEVAENWEEAADSGEIDRRLEKKLKITQRESKSKSPPKTPVVIQDDSLPAGPPPQIRILKRPTSNGLASNTNASNRPALPVKSLAQREAEYAEARKRILGSASPEEEPDKPVADSESQSA
ncbi:Hypothetical predicted protein [Pelobates cultripes]|uniref:SUZ domain-containing protein n=1 Tax=Pelobates cultripes TaxID=61616 RepID=A0AAD1T7P3_PELCU|nr:Hypothetical predicted protein [Pelobates cultripes]